MSEKNALNRILEFAVQTGASDVHFRVGEAPLLRIRGELVSIKILPLDARGVGEICKLLMLNSSIETEMSQIQEVDGSFDLGQLGRFRFNIFRHDGKLGVVLRVIPASVPSLRKLNFPDVIKKIAKIERGLVLVTGSTGQGKSTTLAAMIDYLNMTKRSHIITIEDPVEFVHRPKHCKITQREVGRDTDSFANALRSALRQDPNIILVGELRDPESVDMALKASETGHTVFSTLHTTDAAKSIGRILSMFPAEEQALVRLRLADCLKATISQRLLKRIDGTGRVAAQEIMVTNTAIAECIADPMRTAEIPTFIENSNTQLGSQSFHQHLSQLYRSGIISLEVAKEASANASDFEQSVNYEKNNTLPQTLDALKKEPKTGLYLTSTSVELERPTSPEISAPTLIGGEDKTGIFRKVLRSVKKAS
jgi:twitching motility protein PilT